MIDNEHVKRLFLGSFSLENLDDKAKLALLNYTAKLNNEGLTLFPRRNYAPLLTKVNKKAISFPKFDISQEGTAVSIEGDCFFSTTDINDDFKIGDVTGLYYHELDGGTLVRIVFGRESIFFFESEDDNSARSAALSDFIANYGLEIAYFADFISTDDFSGSIPYSGAEGEILLRNLPPKLMLYAIASQKDKEKMQAIAKTIDFGLSSESSKGWDYSKVIQYSPHAANLNTPTGLVVRAAADETGRQIRSEDDIALASVLINRSLNFPARSSNEGGSSPDSFNGFLKKIEIPNQSVLKQVKRAYESDALTQQVLVGSMTAHLAEGKPLFDEDFYRGVSKSLSVIIPAYKYSERRKAISTDLSDPQLSQIDTEKTKKAISKNFAIAGVREQEVNLDDYRNFVIGWTSSNYDKVVDYVFPSTSDKGHKTVKKGGAFAVPNMRGYPIS